MATTHPVSAWRWCWWRLGLMPGCVWPTQSHPPHGNCPWWHCLRWHGPSSPYILIYSSVWWIDCSGDSWLSLLITGSIVTCQTCLDCEWFTTHALYIIFRVHWCSGWRRCWVNSLIFPHFLPPPLCLLISLSARLYILTGSLFTAFFFFLPFFLSFRERNVRKHSKPGSVPLLSEKEKHVVTVVK